jgi:hypothetical protein
VRAAVAEISVDNMDDLAMYREIQKAAYFVEGIKLSTVTDENLETPIVCLAAYYSHVNYTLLNARQLGTIDESYIIRQHELKRIARAMLLLISNVHITNDLAVDETKYEKIGGIGFALTNGVMNDQRY